MTVSADVEKPSRGHELFLVQLVFVSFAGVATVIRAYVKIFLVGRVTVDDYLIFAAMVSLCRFFLLKNTTLTTEPGCVCCLCRHCN